MLTYSSPGPAVMRRTGRAFLIAIPAIAAAKRQHLAHRSISTASSHLATPRKQNQGSRRLALTNDAAYELVMNVAAGQLDAVDDIAAILLRQLPARC
jgi:hypothetical protein